MNQTNTLLSCMLTAYIIPIAFVFYKYKAQSQEMGTRSISSIITSTEPFLSFIPRSSTSPPLYSKRDTSSRYVCLSWRVSQSFTNIRDNDGLSSPSSSFFAEYSVLFLFPNKTTHIISLRQQHSSQSSVLWWDIHSAIKASTVTTISASFFTRKYYSW